MIFRYPVVIHDVPMKTFHKVLLKVLKFQENDDEVSNEAHESLIHKSYLIYM